MLLLYQFWQTEICICCKPRPTREKCDLQIALTTTLTLPFFHTSDALPARHIHAIFELSGRPSCSSLLVSIFLSLWLWKEFNSHSFVVTFHFSCSFGLPPVFYPTVDDCWIHINVGCSACIYSRLFMVSLNDESRLAHQRQQSVDSAFQFHYSFLP